MKDSRLCCIFFGTGSIGKRHIKILRSLLKDEIRIIAYKTSDRDAGILEKELGVELFHDIDEAFAEKPDFAVIANPTSLHVQYAIKSAEHGCDLFLEKPVSDSMKDIGRLQKIIDQKKLISFVLYVLRFSKPLNEIKRIIDSREIGKVITAEVHVGSSLAERHGKGWDYKSSYAAKKALGGGVSLDLSHEIDYARWLFGELEIKDAFVGKESGLDIDADDTCDIRAVSDKGIDVKIHMDYIESPARRFCRIICEKGEIFWQWDRGVVEVTGQDPIDVKEDYDDMFARQMSHFLECIKKRAETSIPLQEGVRTLDVVLKAKKISGWE